MKLMLICKEFARDLFLFPLGFFIIDINLSRLMPIDFVLPWIRLTDK